MTVQRVAETWPQTCGDVISLARDAMPLDQRSHERVLRFAGLIADALSTADVGDREGMQFQFSRESLEDVIGAATGRSPERRDMLHVIPTWRSCFIAGIAACDGRLRELEQASPATRP